LVREDGDWKVDAFNSPEADHGDAKPCASKIGEPEPQGESRQKRDQARNR
jgi:hypothetical protein